MTPTSKWLSTTTEFMPPLDGPAGIAERLLLLIYYGIDWTSWVSRFRATLWNQQLPDRVTIATYRHNTLQAWWNDVAGSLESKPRNAAERRELEALLRHDPDPVLEVLRSQTPALLLRTRIVVDEVRATRDNAA